MEELTMTRTKYLSELKHIIKEQIIFLLKEALWPISYNNEDGRVVFDNQKQKFRDPEDSTIFLTADEFFEKYSEANKFREEIEQKIKARLNRKPTKYDMLIGDYVTDEESQKIRKELIAKGLTPEELQKIETARKSEREKTSKQFSFPRLLKQIFAAKAKQDEWKKTTKIHWVSNIEQFKNILSGKIPKTAELSANIFPSIEGVNHVWGSIDTGFILDGRVTYAGSEDMRSDNMKSTGEGEKRSDQKYSYILKNVTFTPEQAIKGSSSGHNEALIDNWRIIGVVTGPRTPPEISQLVKQVGLPIYSIQK